VADASFSLLTGNSIETRLVRAGGIIFREGEQANELFVIKSGYVRIQVGNKTMADLAPDTIFGEMALIDNEPRSATATALTDVELVPVSEKQFLFLVSQTPERFRAKWIPVRVKKTRQVKNLEPRSDSIGTGKALAGARGDLAAAAQRRGLRGVRLKSLLMILEARFTEPDFSAHKLAAATGLSERYVNELLYEAGASFTMRLTELRLAKAAKLLVHDAERRISDIAFDCGFNDLSYFNRCFRRRFGLTPSAARGT
jgi:AraC-like DNA-binding protein